MSSAFLPGKIEHVDILILSNTSVKIIPSAATPRAVSFQYALSANGGIFSAWASLPSQGIITGLIQNTSYEVNLRGISVYGNAGPDLTHRAKFNLYRSEEIGEFSDVLNVETSQFVSSAEYAEIITYQSPLKSITTGPINSDTDVYVDTALVSRQISIINGEYAIYDKNRVLIRDFGSDSFIVHSGEFVRLRTVASSFSDTQKIVSLTVGSTTRNWSVKTKRGVQLAALSALNIFGNSFTVGANAGNIIGVIQGNTSGSTLSLVDDHSGAVAISGTNLVVGLNAPGVVGSFDVTVRETFVGASNSPRDTVFAITVNAIINPIRTVSIGKLTKSGVIVASLQAGATLSGANADYFSIDAFGNISVSIIGDTANLGIDTYDLSVNGDAEITTLRLITRAFTYSVDNSAAFSVALAEISSENNTVDWSIHLIDGANINSDLTINVGFAGAINYVNAGKGSADAILDQASIALDAVPTVSGGSLRIYCETPKSAQISKFLTLKGAGPYIIDGVIFSNIPSSDAYDGKFNDVTQGLRWSPIVNESGAVTGVASILTPGAGYLASPNERRAYVATKETGGGSGFLGWFDVNDDGTINSNSPLTIVSPGVGYSSGVVFRTPTLYETTQLATCQSNVQSAQSTLQLRVINNGSVLPKVVIKNCLFGAGYSLNKNRLPVCIDVRNADQIYIHDNEFYGYYSAVQIWMANDAEVTRNFSRKNVNDFFKEYPTYSFVGNQQATGTRTRMLANVLCDPLVVSDWSNSHADAHQVGTATDTVSVRDFMDIGNYIFWPSHLKDFSSQGELHSVVGHEYKQYFANNFYCTSTPNAAQLTNAWSKDRAKFLRNTCIRYMADAYTGINSFSPGQPSSVEPWIFYKGAYVAGTTYYTGDVVAFGGGYYVSKHTAGHSGNQPDQFPAYWTVLTSFDIEISNNILGAIWERAPTTGLALKYADPINGTRSDLFYNYHATGNAYISNFTDNTNAGSSYPEVFSGGLTGMGSYQGAGIGYNGFVSGVRTDTYAHVVEDINALFTPVPGSIADGKGHTAQPSISDTNGTVIAARVSNVGFQVDMDIPGFVVGGAISATPFATPKAVLAVSGPGFDGNGNAITAVRNVPVLQGPASGAERQAYPNHAQRVESVSGGILTSRLVLAQRIYAGETISATLLSGLYTDNGAGGSGAASQAGNLASVTNNSALTCPKPVVQWVSPQWQQATGTSFPVEVFVAHRYGRNGKPVNAVRFTATGQTSGATYQTVVNTMVRSDVAVRAGYYVPVFRGSIVLAGFTQGELVTVDVEAFPFVGPKYQASVDGDAFPTPNMTTLRFLCDKNGTYSGAIAYVSTTGNNGTGVVSASDATAIANPFADVGGAAIAIAAWNNANKGHNDIGGGTIKLMAGTHANATSWIAPAGGNTFLTITRDPATTRAAAIWGLPTQKGSAANAKIRFYDITFTPPSSAGASHTLIDFADPTTQAKYAWFDNCDVNGLGGANPIFYRIGNKAVTNCYLKDMGSSGLVPFGTEVTAFGLVAGNILDNTNAAAYGPTSAYCCVGNQFKNAAAGTTFCTNVPNDLPSTNTTAVQPKGVVIAFNTVSNLNASTSLAVGMGRAIVGGCAVINNVVEKAKTNAPCIRVSADSVTTAVDAVLLVHNTTAGGRLNFCYNDVWPNAQKDGVLFGNLFFEQNIKRDVFAANGNAVMNWATSHHADFHGNVTCLDASDGHIVNFPGGDSWLGDAANENEAFAITIAAMQFTSYAGWIKTPATDGAGNGDYHIGFGSAAKNRIAAGRAMYPFDIDGAARKNDGTGAAGAYEAAA